MLSSLDTLYNILPLDTVLRKHKLAQICKHSTKPMQMLLSFRVHRDNIVTINTTINNVMYDEYDLRYIVHKIVKSTTKKELQQNIQLLNTNHQIVFKHLLLKTFNSDVIIQEIPKLYLMREIESFLFSHREGRIYYVIHNSKKLDYTFRSGKTTYSSIKNKMKRPNVPSSMCILTDNGKIIVMGDKSLYTYVKGSTTKFTLVNQLPYVSTTLELQHIKNGNKGKYITIFDTILTTEYIPEDIFTTKPIDWLVDSNYNPIGYTVLHNDNMYGVKYKITKKLFNIGLDVVLSISHGTYRNRITKLTVKEVILNE